MFVGQGLFPEAVRVVVHGADGGKPHAEFQCERRLACDRHADDVRDFGERPDFGDRLYPRPPGLGVDAAHPGLRHQFPEGADEIRVQFRPDMVDGALVDGRDVGDAQVVSGDNKRARRDLRLQGAGGAERYDIVHPEDGERGEARPVVDAVWGEVVLVAQEEGEGSGVDLGLPVGRGDGLLLKRRQVGEEEACAPDDPEHYTHPARRCTPSRRAGGAVAAYARPCDMLCRGLVSDRKIPSIWCCRIGS